MNSAIYTGKVRHTRYEPFLHSFTYRLFMAWLNVDEIENLFKNSFFWNTNGRALIEFRRSDYLFDENISIGDEIRNIVEKETGKRPEGAIYMLTHLRYFGHNFNPVTFYYCFDSNGGTVNTIVAQVTNTPWNERFCYVLDTNENQGEKLSFEKQKQFHVSPFIDMDHTYKWMFTEPGDELTVHMENYKNSSRYFAATLSLKRKPMTKGKLRNTVIAFPFMTVKVVAAIYWQALKLKLKGAKYYPHPNYSTRNA